jgi:hypothetical protein
MGQNADNPVFGKALWFYCYFARATLDLPLEIYSMNPVDDDQQPSFDCFEYHINSGE